MKLLVNIRIKNNFSISSKGDIMLDTHLESTYSKKMMIIFVSIVIFSQGMASPYFYLNWILGAIMIYFCFVKMIKNRKIKIASIYSLSVSLLWTLPLLLNILGSSIVDYSEHLTYLCLIIFYTIVSILIVSFLFGRNLRQRNAIILFVNQIWIFISLISYLFFAVFNEYYGSPTFSGIMENRNVYAITTTILASYLIFYKNTYENSKKINTLIVISFLLILATFSVKGFAGWLLLYVLSSFYNSDISKYKKNRNQLVVIILVFSIVAFLIATENPIIYRIERFFMVFTAPDQLRQSESAFLRGYFIQESINVIKDNPITGVGLRNSKYYLVPPSYIAQGLNVGTYSHNNFLEIFLSGGMFSFILYYFPFVMSVFKSRKRMKKDNLYNYLFILGIYKLFIDVGSVNYDILIMTIIFIAIIYGQFLSLNNS